MLLDAQATKYRLGIVKMDETHQEFIHMVNQLEAADKATFATLFLKLLEHTRAHFGQEEEWMLEFDFPALREHTSEHQRVLGEMTRFAERVKAGSLQMARAYVREQLPSWFELHAATMDSALAGHMKFRGQENLLQMA